MDNDGVFRPTKKEKKEFKKAAKEWADGKHEDVTEKYGDISTWDTSKITDMSKLFKEKRNFNGDISNWDVSNVTNMQEMFYNAKAFNQPIGKWNVSEVTNMKGMFEGAHAFNQFIGSWDVSNVENMGYMFEGAHAFNNGQTNNEGNAPLDWNVSKVTDMGRMFVRAKNFNQPIVWDVSNVTNMFNMFWSAESFNQSIEEWDVSKISTNYIETMFKYSGYIHPKPDVERSKARYRDKQNLSGVQIAARNSLPDHRVMEELGLRKSVPSALSKRGETEMHPRVRQVLSWEEGRGPQISEWLGGKRKTKKRKTKKRKTKKSNRK
jgi:surface protein